MATSLKLRRGTTTAHSTFTGAEGEVTVDTTKDTIVVHDGSTAGGFPLLKENNPLYTGTLTGGTGVVNLGSGQFYKDASGNVGIGTSSPSTKLNVYDATSAIVDVSGDSGVAYRLTRYSSDGNVPVTLLRKARGTFASPTAVNSADNIGQINFQGYGGSNFRNIASITSLVTTYTSDTNISGVLTFATNGGSTSASERMRIDSSGNVGIGTSSPANALVVSRSGGTAAYIQTVSGTNSSLFGHGAGGELVTGAFSNQPYLFFTNSTERMRIDSSGNVGIGTASPSQKLSVVGNGLFSSSGTTELNLSTTSTDTNTAHVIGALSNSTFNYANLIISSNTTRFNISGSERMRIDNDGNVGIGTSSPAARLDVTSTSNNIVLSTSTGGYAAIQRKAPTGQQLYDFYTVNNTEVARITADPSYLGFSTTSAATERMRIHASGGLSIGNQTDSGAASLNVSGSISGGYVALADGTTAMPFGADNVVRVTPTATATYTTTVPAAGAICVLSILTSGTTSRTITFGTGFKSTGTLATGTVSARYFNITFVSDGTNLIEMSRTVAIA